ncbi:MAG TPA: alpha/beta fold hydrolase [Acidimicrobiia bacterium]|nr:alpha/beta fold hydrolase [Acidimicrobiia bacterium]
MSVPTLPGIRTETVTTSRITTRVLFSGPTTGAPVLFLHGNLSCATWWETTMLRLPAGFQGVAPDQRGFGEADSEKKIDATNGLGDPAGDALALLDELDIERVHLVGNSMGGSVVWRLIADAPERIITATQVAPGSPFGFGGTRDVDGRPCWDDFAGSGGGLINAQVVERLRAGDDGIESPFSPRNALRSLIVVPGSVPENEDGLVAAMLSTHLGEQDYPGDMTPSANWPFVAPGTMGVNNALSPKYTSGLVDRLLAANPKPPIAWVRGELDRVVSDQAAGDPGTLGAFGLIPDWPGAETYPSQPMLGQTRRILERYAEMGGEFSETIIAATAHVPFIEEPTEFDRVFHAHIEKPGGNRE